MTEEHDLELWSDEARENFLDASAVLQASLAAQISTVSAARDGGDLAGVLAANDALDVAASAYAEAQFLLTGTFPAFEAEDDLDDDLGLPDQGHAPAKSVMLLSRDVYGVVSEDDVVEAGRRAYQRVWPGSTRERAEAEVTELGTALYEIAHDGGLDAVATTEGLRPAGRTTWFVATPTQFELTPDDLEKTPFELDADADIVYRMDEVR